MITKNVLISFNLSLFILFLFSPKVSFSQCDEYNYFLDIQGFACDNEGAICIIANNLECLDYVIELEFPTSSFNISNLSTLLGQINIQAPNATSTIIRYIPAPTSAFPDEGCIEGQLIAPNTAFTLRIVNINDASDIIENYTFGVDNIPTVGTPGQTTLLSEAINQEVLAPQGQAPMGGQRFYVEGTLAIDMDYYMAVPYGSQINHIILGSDAEIEVQSDNSFRAALTSFNGCDEKWNRINVQAHAHFGIFSSTISDAKVAVELQDKSIFQAFNSTLNNNDIGIGSFGDTPKELFLEIVANSLKPLFIKNSIEGIYLENAGLVPLIGADTYGNAIQFKNIVNNAIYLDNTNLISHGAYFNNFQNGINVRTPNELLDVDHCIFESGSIGLISYGSSEAFVTNSNFSYLWRGIGKASSHLNEYTLISDNNMTECGINIFASTMSSEADIKNNFLLAKNENIWLFGYGEESHDWDIQNNYDLGAGITNGNPSIADATNIVLWNTEDVLIKNNPSLFSTGQNIAITGGLKNQIEENLGYAEKNNITINASTAATIHCNDFNGDTGLKVINNCSSSIISTNTFTSSNLNVTYGSSNNTFAVSAPQPFKGNIFDISTPSMPKTKHFSSSLIASQSRYNIGTLSDHQGDEYFPFFDSEDEFWFTPRSTRQDLICVSNNVETPVDIIKQIKNTQIELLNLDIEDKYGKETAFDTEFKLYKSLRQLEDYETLSIEDAAIQQELSGKESGKFAELQLLLKEAIAMDEATETQLDNMSTDIHSLVNQIKDIQWFEPDATGLDVIIDESQKQLRDDLLNELKSKLADRKTIQVSRQSELLNELTSIKTINESIDNFETVSAENFKNVNQLMYQRMEQGFGKFSPKEIDELKNIASQCIGTGGESVLTARALLAEIDFSAPHYNDECLIEKTEKALKDETLTEWVNQIAISPNPAKDEVLVSFDNIMESDANLFIHNTMGRLAKKVSVNKGQQSFTINIDELLSGIYFISLDNQPVKTIKLVVAQ